MPWKNGGGETAEIAISPPGATLDTLNWRVSMAVVAQDGPFSLFPGIDRTLCILDGPGIALDFGNDGVNESGMHTITPESVPFHFSADRSVQARLLGGTITDLNVMTRRSGYRHTVHRIALDRSQTLTTSAEASLLFCERGDVSCAVADAAEIQLGARDCAVIEGRAGRFDLSTQSLASVYLIQFYRTT